MAIQPARTFRLIVPADIAEQPQNEGSGGALLREALETTRLLHYARRLWRTSHNRIRFLLELPVSRRWLEVELSAEYAAGTPVTLVEGGLAELPHRLTAREVEVLTLVAAGHSNPTIAEALFTSPRTVSTQVETIRGKLEAGSRTAAGVLAVQNGWLRMPMPVDPDLLGSLDIADLLRDLVPPVSPAFAAESAPTPKPPPPIRLGLVYPASGPARGDGQQSRRGALLAIDEINSRGGVRGRLLEAVHVDADIYSSEGVRRTFAGVLEQEVHGALMSYVFDESAAFEGAARLGVPVLHTMTSRRQLKAVRSDPVRYRAIFQCVPPESNYGPGLVRFLDLFASSAGGGELPRTIRFLETPVDSGQIADAETLALLQDRSWTAIGIDDLTGDPEALERLTAEILAEPPAVLVISEFLPEALASLLRRLHVAHCPSVIYTIYTPSVPEFIDRVGDAAEGVVWATVSGTYSDPFGAEFRAAYATTYGEAPGLSQAGLAYDMTHVIAAAWQQSADPSDVPGTLAALRSTRYRGVNGSYNFASGLQTTIAYPEETNDPSLGNAQLIFQVQDGEHRCLGPAPYADGEFRLPQHL